MPRCVVVVNIRAVDRKYRIGRSVFRHHTDEHGAFYIVLSARGGIILENKFALGYGKTGKIVDFRSRTVGRKLLRCSCLRRQTLGAASLACRGKHKRRIRSGKIDRHFTGSPLDKSPGDRTRLDRGIGFGFENLHRSVILPDLNRLE